MPSWKKLIVSGSNASLNNLTVTSGVTGSLLGTASYASQAISASYVNLLAGPNITINYQANGIAITGSAGGSGTPGGSPNQIQYNSASAFGGVPVLTYDGTTLIGTGSFTGSFTGALTGTSSWAISASQAISASYVPAGGGDQQIQFNNQGNLSGSSLFRYNYLSQSIEFGPSAARALAPYSFAIGGTAITTATGAFAQGDVGTIAGGTFSYAHGYWAIATGSYSHAEGNITRAVGAYSHAEGRQTNASGSDTHAEGFATLAIGRYSHTEGSFTTATGQSSHAEGANTQAIGLNSHAEGRLTQAIGDYSHAEGFTTIATGLNSHAEGSLTQTIGDYSHAEGSSSIANGTASHAEGWGTVTLGSFQHVQGQFNISSSAQSAFIIGNGTSDSNRSNLVFASGSVFQITGSLEVSGSITGSLFGTSSWAVSASQAITASYVAPAGSNFQIQYNNNGTLGATGSFRFDYNSQSLAQGFNVTASGVYSHAEGFSTQAIGDYSHAEGLGTVTSGSYQHAQGQYNLSSSAQSAFIIGNGVDTNNRSNLVFASGSQFQITGSLQVTGSAFVLGLTNTSQTNVLTYNSTTGQVFFTASNAIGGGGGSTVKAGSGSVASFGGSPLTSSITFGSAFSNNSYAVTVTGEDARSWTIQSKTSAGFTINSNSSVGLTGPVYWMATPFGS